MIQAANSPLPAVPSLDVSHMVEESVAVGGCGDLSALRPHATCYKPADPNVPALVLLPGLDMDGLGFVRQLPLGAMLDLHLFQLPNEQFVGEEGLNSHARFAEEYIRQCGLDKRPGGVIVGGCSMGGAVSLRLACRQRIKLRGLILIGTFGSCRHLPRWQRIFAPAAWVLPVTLLRPLARQVVKRTGFFGKIRGEESDWLVSCKLQRTQSYFAHAAAALTQQEQIAEARKLTVPTLVIHGTDDNVLPYCAGQELAEAIPGAKLITVGDSGHAVFFTHPDETNRSIAEFIGALPAVQPS